MTDWSAIAGAAIGAVAGWAVAARQAGAQQDRAAAQRLRGVCRAVLVDLDRIEDCLGNDVASPHGIRVGRLTFQGPEIHPWIVGMIPEVAAGDLEILRLLMELEASLTSDRAAAEAIEAQYEGLAELGTRINELGRTVSFDGGVHHVPAGADDSERLSLEGDRKRLVEELDTMKEMREEYRATIRAGLQQLRALLIPIAHGEVPAITDLILPRVPEDAALEATRSRQLLEREGKRRDRK